MTLGALTLMNQVLITPAFKAKKEAEEEHPEWKELSIKGVEIPVEDMQKGIIISAVALLTVIVGFFMFYRPVPKTDIGSEIIRDVESVTDESAEEPKEKSTTPSSVISEEEFKTGQEIKESIESNSTSDKSSLDINKAHDIAEKAKQQNWLKVKE